MVLTFREKNSSAVFEKILQRFLFHKKPLSAAVADVVDSTSIASTD